MYGFNTKPLTEEEQKEYIIKAQKEDKKTMSLAVKAYVSGKKKEAEEHAEFERKRYGR